jgi:integrase
VTTFTHKKEAARQSHRKYYERDEILALLKEADPQWKAMVLLGINGAMEPNEVSALDWSVVDLEGRWFRKQRSKVAGRSDAPRLFW